MDWTKMGALGTLGCLVVAIVTLVFVVKPLPWSKSDKGKTSVPQRIPKGLVVFLGIVIGASLILSIFSIWSAWHPAAFTHQPREQLQAVEDKQFVNDTLEIDGKRFDRCDFNNVKLRYQGRENAALGNSQFHGTLAMGTDSPAVQATMELVVNFLREADLVDKQKVGFDHNGDLVLILHNKGTAASGPLTPTEH